MWLYFLPGGIGVFVIISYRVLAAIFSYQVDIPDQPETLEALLWAIVVAQFLVIGYLYRKAEEKNNLVYGSFPALMETVKSIDEQLRVMDKQSEVERLVQKYMEKLEKRGGKDG